MDRGQKLEVLSHRGIDPTQLKDPYDRLSVVLDRWKNVATDAYLSHYDEEKKAKLSGKYYDAVIAPQYAAMGKPPMSREVWQAQAYKEATEYKLENAYDNTILHNLKHGWNNQVPSIARFGEGIYNVVSNLVAKPKEITDDNYKELFTQDSWADRAHAATSTPRSFTDARNPSSPVNRGSQRQQEEHQFWADALPVKGGWGAQATSFIAEQATQLPIYVALSAVPMTAGESLTARLGLTAVGKKSLGYLLTGAEGTSYGVLTRSKGDKQNAWKDGLSWMMFNMGFDVLGKAGSKLLSAVGQKGKATLSAAVEASGDSDLLEKLKTKQQRLELAAGGKELAGGEEQYAAFKKEAASNMAAIGVHGQREVYADALRHIENMEQVRDNSEPELAKGFRRIYHGSATPGRLEGDAWFSRFKDYAKNYRQGAQLQYVDLSEDVYNKHFQPEGSEAEGVAPLNNVELNSSITGPRNILESRPWTRSQVKEYEKQLLTEDPARWSPTITAANYVRALLGESKLKDLKDGSPEMKHLVRGISQLVTDAAAEITQHVPEIAQHEAETGAQVTLAKTGSALKTLDYFKAQIQKKAQASGASSLVKPEDLDNAAKKSYLDYIRKATQTAAKERHSTPEMDAAKTIKEHRAEIKKAQSSAEVEPLYKQQTRRGKDYVWYSVAPSYKAELTNRAKSVGASTNVNSKEFSEWLASHYDGMEAGDFAQDIEDHFYPQALKDAGIYFEHQNAGKAGPEFPNFLAFMHNYAAQMPKEMAKELEERLAETEKFQQAFKSGAKTQDILDYYSKGMYNHVDDFLGSGHWPAETNIFRSTFDLVRGTTKYQKELLKEKAQQEELQLRDSFAKHPEAQAAALKALKQLQSKRMQAFTKSYDQDPNSRETVYELNELITQEITKHKLYDRWEF
jgi:hypothetical protein